jgi:hypothetical protein
VDKAEEAGGLGARTFSKRGTPTMGGILIVGVMDVTALLWAQWTTHVALTLISVLVLAGLGFYDDYAKITQQSNKGAKANIKLWVQCALGLFIAVYLWRDPQTEKLITEVMVPFVKYPVATGVVGAIVPPPPVTAKITLVPVTGLPLTSRTTTAGAMGTAAATGAVCVFPRSIAICVAGPAVMVIAPDVTPVRPVVANAMVRAPTVPVIRKSLKIASPFAPVTTAVVPPKVPPPLARLAVTLTPACATVLPAASRSRTTGPTANTAPFAAVADGAVTSASCVAAPAPTEIALDATDGTPVDANDNV